MLRCGGADRGTAWQPYGAGVHVDYSSGHAENMSKEILQSKGYDDYYYSRVVFVNIWRCLSSGPQDWPLGLCDASSVNHNEGERCIIVRLSEPLSDRKNIPDIEPYPDSHPAAMSYEYQDTHKWYYYSDMHNGEAVLFKLYDSDKSKTAFRVPHSAFHDAKEGTVPRESIEIRTVAYFK